MEQLLLKLLNIIPLLTKTQPSGFIKAKQFSEVNEVRQRRLESQY